MYLPHEVYPAMVSDGLSGWVLKPEDIAGPNKTGLGKLMTEWAAHDDVRFAGDLATVAALGFHADGVTYTSSHGAGKQKSVLVASLNVISAADSKRHIRMPLFLLRKGRMCQCGCGGFHTMQTILQVVAWSCRCLLAGLTPSLRHDGTRFNATDRDHRAPARQAIPRAALLQVRGDWEGLQSFCRIRTHNQTEFCWMCDCTLHEGPSTSSASAIPHRTERPGSVMARISDDVPPKASSQATSSDAQAWSCNT